MALLDVERLAVEANEQPELVLAVGAQAGRDEFGHPGEQLDAGLLGLGRELDENAPAVAWVRYPLHETAPIQAVDHGRDRAAGQAGVPREVTRAHPPVLVQDVHRAAVGPVDPHQLRCYLVDGVGGALVGADQVGQLPHQPQPRLVGCVRRGSSGAGGLG